MSWCRTVECTGFRFEHTTCVDCGVAVATWFRRAGYELYDPVTQTSRALCDDCYASRQPKAKVNHEYNRDAGQ